MIPKSLRFKCCHCGHLKKRPGKCVWCGKIADFDNLMGGSVENRRHASYQNKSGWNGTLQPNSVLARASRISDRPAHQSNFPVPVLADAATVSPQWHGDSGEARESTNVTTIKGSFQWTLAAGNTLWARGDNMVLEQRLTVCLPEHS